MERNRTYETKGKQQSGRSNLTAPKTVLNVNRPTLQVQCRGYPTGYKKQDPAEVIFKRDSPDTKTQRTSLRGQRMDSANLGCKSTGGAVGSAIREKVQSARKCKISSVHILNGRASKFKNQRIRHSHNYSCRFQHSSLAPDRTKEHSADHPTVLDRLSKTLSWSSCLQDAKAHSGGLSPTSWGMEPACHSSREWT